MRRRWGILSVMGLAIWGCGEPEITPMTPPGVPFTRPVDDGAEALGEKLSQGTVQPANVAPGSGTATDNGREKTSPPTAPDLPAPK